LEVFGWGRNNERQLGVTSSALEYILEPALIDVVSHLVITSVAAGGTHTLFLSKDKEVFAIGSNKNGQIGWNKSSNDNAEDPVKVDFKGKNIVSIECGIDHCLALSEDGTVWSWGRGYHGQLGHGDVEDQLVPLQISAFKDRVIVAIGCGNDFSAFLTDEGELYCFGNNDCGQLGTGDTDLRNGPCLVSTISDKGVVAFSCGGSHTLALTVDDMLYIWGMAQGGRLGIESSEENVLIPTELKGITGTVTKMECGGGHSMVLNEENELWVWGFGAYGRLGFGDELNRTSPTKSKYFQGKKIVDFTLSVDHTIVIAEDL